MRVAFKIAIGDDVKEYPGICLFKGDLAQSMPLALVMFEGDPEPWLIDPDNTGIGLKQLSRYYLDTYGFHGPILIYGIGAIACHGDEIGEGG